MMMHLLRVYQSRWQHVITASGISYSKCIDSVYTNAAPHSCWGQLLYICIISWRIVFFCFFVFAMAVYSQGSDSLAEPVHHHQTEGVHHQISHVLGSLQ